MKLSQNIPVQLKLDSEGVPTKVRKSEDEKTINKTKEFLYFLENLGLSNYSLNITMKGAHYNLDNLIRIWHSQITNLNLAESRVTKDDVLRLIYSNPQLKTLDLTRCPTLSNEDIAEFQGYALELKQDLKIIH